MSSTLQLTTYHAEIGPFPVSSVIVAGDTEAVLIDAQFTRADAHRVVSLVLATGKHLTSVYVSHGDPDYYFGLGVIRDAFPDTQIVASGPTVEHIAHSAAAKLATWGPQLGSNGPANVLLPNVLEGDHLDLEGHRLEIVGLDGETPDRSFVWIPDLEAVVGGVVVYGGLHLFTADTAKPEARTAGRTSTHSTHFTRRSSCPAMRRPTSHTTSAAWPDLGSTCRSSNRQSPTRPTAASSSRQ